MAAQTKPVGRLQQYRAEAFTSWPTIRSLGAHWSVHPACATGHLAPMFLAPPAWMCGDQT